MDVEAARPERICGHLRLVCTCFEFFVLAYAHSRFGSSGGITQSVIIAMAESVDDRHVIAAQAGRDADRAVIRRARSRRSWIWCVPTAI